MINFFKIFTRVKKEKFFCPFCKEKTLFENMGRPVRLNVRCSVCGSLERHRFLYFVYNIIFLGRIDKINLLHLSPERCIHDLLKKYAFIDYVSADLNPASYFFTDCKKEDFTKMSFGNKIFDVILSNQVMEHIEDEQGCLKEMKRCLKDSGVLIVNIPFKVGLEKTLENKKIISEEDRRLIYGQEDHVRLYGEDAVKRFEEAGFVVNRISESIFNKEFLNYCRLSYTNSEGINPGGYFVLRKRIE